MKLLSILLAIFTLSLSACSNSNSDQQIEELHNRINDLEEELNSREQFIKEESDDTELFFSREEERLGGHKLEQKFPEYQTEITEGILLAHKKLKEDYEEMDRNGEKMLFGYSRGFNFHYIADKHVLYMWGIGKDRDRLLNLVYEFERVKDGNREEKSEYTEKYYDQYARVVGGAQWEIARMRSKLRKVLEDEFDDSFRISNEMTVVLEDPRNPDEFDGLVSNIDNLYPPLYVLSMRKQEHEYYGMFDRYGSHMLQRYSKEQTEKARNEKEES